LASCVSARQQVFIRQLLTRDLCCCGVQKFIHLVARDIALALRSLDREACARFQTGNYAGARA
jgi:hypothetical protein